MSLNSNNKLEDKLVSENVTVDTLIVKNGDKYGTLPKLDYTNQEVCNYQFLGWFTEAIGGTQITKDTIVNLSGNQTLYAHWNLNISDNNHSEFFCAGEYALGGPAPAPAPPSPVS